VATNPPVRNQLQSYLDKARKYAKDDPEIGGVHLRKFWEATILHLGAEFDCSAGENEYQLKNTFDNLRTYIPALAHTHLNYMKNVGNYSAHHQLRSDEYSLTSDVITYCVNQGYTLIDMFLPLPQDAAPVLTQPPKYSLPSLVEHLTQYPTDASFFIEKIEDAFGCSYCGVSIGYPCITKDGEHVSEGREHTIRKRLYSQYRKRFQASYGTTIIKTMHEYTLEMKPDDRTSSQAIVAWFKVKYPAYTEQAVRAHITMMCTNSPSRIHHSQHEKDGCQLFYQLEKGVSLYKLYNSEEHPPPITRSGISESLSWTCPICTTLQSRDNGACFVCSYQGRTNDRF
jgi:hypothetical protein